MSLGPSKEDSLLQTILGDTRFSRQQSKNCSSSKQDKASSVTTTPVQTPPEQNVLLSNEKIDTKFESGQDGRLTLTSFVPPIPEQEIVENRLSVEKIQEIPRFRDYEPGNPSKVTKISQSFDNRLS